MLEMEFPIFAAFLLFFIFQYCEKTVVERKVGDCTEWEVECMMSCRVNGGVMPVFGNAASHFGDFTISRF